MLKRVAVLVAAGVLAFAIAGCSSGTSSSAASSAASSASASASASAASSSSAASALFSDLSWPENEVTEGVPVPKFSVAPDGINENELIISGTWKGLSDQEVLDYIEQVKAAGFTFKASENKTSNTYNYSAQNKDEYRDFTSVNIAYSAANENSPSSFMLSVSRYK